MFKAIKPGESKDFKPLKNEVARLEAKVAALESEVKGAEKKAAEANWQKAEAQSKLRTEQAGHAATKAMLEDERSERRAAEDRNTSLLSASSKNGAVVQPQKTGWRVTVTGHDGVGRLKEFEMHPLEPVKRTVQ
jgi:phage shock protein A